MNKSGLILGSIIVAAISLALFSGAHPAAEAREDGNLQAGPQPSPTCDSSVPPAAPIYGVTIEKIKDLKNIVKSLKVMNSVHRPTTRIVFQQGDEPAVYEKAVRKIKQEENVSDVMGLIADSSAMYPYQSVEDYEKRVTQYLDGLPQNVDIWEIGNEVNGEWVGWNDSEWETKTPDDRKAKRELVSKQIIAGFKLAKARGKKTALTLYYQGDDDAPCWPTELPDGKEYEMFAWTEKYLDDPELRNCLDYLFVSFYQDDCHVLTRNLQADIARWVSVFTQLAGKFPNAKVGFGEFGPQCYYEDCNFDTANGKDRRGRNRNCRECLANQKEFLPRYYADYDAGIRKANVPRYVGGYFYWYFWQDMVPPNRSGLGCLKEALEGRRNDACR